nr:hypothetical protein [Tanacetum cinerariifolium]
MGRQLGTAVADKLLHPAQVVFQRLVVDDQRGQADVAHQVVAWLRGAFFDRGNAHVCSPDVVVRVSHAPLSTTLFDDPPGQAVGAVDQHLSVMRIVRGSVGTRRDDAQGGNADALLVADRRGEAMGEGVGNAVEGNVLAPVEQAHLCGFPGLLDDLTQADFGLAGEIEVAQMRLTQEVQLPPQVHVAVFADRLQNAPLQQRTHQFIHRRLGAADATGDLVGPKRRTGLLEKIENIERPVQTSRPAFDGVFGHWTSSRLEESFKLQVSSGKCCISALPTCSLQFKACRCSLLLLVGDAIDLDFAIHHHAGLYAGAGGRVFRGEVLAKHLVEAPEIPRVFQPYADPHDVFEAVPGFLPGRAPRSPHRRASGWGSSQWRVQSQRAAADRRTTAPESDCDAQAGRRAPATFPPGRPLGPWAAS